MPPGRTTSTEARRLIGAAPTSTRRTRPSSRRTSSPPARATSTCSGSTLRNGARIDDKDSWNGTGLIRAAERGHHGVVGQLLQAGIDRDHVNRIGYQAIHEAVWLGEDTDDYATTLRVLAAGGVAADQRVARRGAHSAADGAAPRLRRAGEGADPDDRRASHRATRRRATARRHAGDADGVAIALRAGAGLEARDARRRTALLLAATHDHVDVAKVLVAMGADPDALDDRHDTPWLVTGVTGSVAMLEALLPANPDLSIQNRFGGLSLIPASERGHVDYVRRVVSTDIDVNHINRLGWTALLEAVILGDGGRRPPGDRAHPPRRGSRPRPSPTGWGHCPGARPVEGIRRAREHPVGSVKSPAPLPIVEWRSACNELPGAMCSAGRRSLRPGKLTRSRQTSKLTR